MSKNPNQYQGVAYIRVNGLELPTMEGATFTPSGSVREVVKGARVWGFKAKPQEATLECKLAGGNGISVQDIQSWDNVTVEFEADTGEKHMMANAWTSDATTITDGGEISAKFAARASKRIA